MLPPAHREAIREIFLRRRTEYTTREAANLLRMNQGDFVALIQAGVLDAQVRKKRRQLGGLRQVMVPWNELASAATLRWTIVQIHDALGKEANTTLPTLLRPVELKAVRLPEYLVRLIEALARNAGVTVEEYVYTSLLGLEAAASPDVMEQMLPGFTEAVRFPDV